MTYMSEMASLNFHGTHRPIFALQIEIISNSARFEGLMVVLLKMLIFLDVSIMSIYQ
jgi:hypothetical protein